MEEITFEERERERAHLLFFAKLEAREIMIPHKKCVFCIFSKKIERERE